MVRFNDDANRFWLEQSLDKGEMPKRVEPATLLGFRLRAVDFATSQMPGVVFRSFVMRRPQTGVIYGARPDGMIIDDPEMHS